MLGVNPDVKDCLEDLEKKKGSGQERFHLGEFGFTNKKGLYIAVAVYFHVANLAQGTKKQYSKSCFLATERGAITDRPVAVAVPPKVRAR